MRGQRDPKTLLLQTGQHKRAGLVVVTIELEKALSQTMSNMQPTKTWSPYRDPLAKFLNRYAAMVPPPPPPLTHARCTFSTFGGTMWLYRYVEAKSDLIG